jgi:membrane associated rhomboid family serine protease
MAMMNRNDISNFWNQADGLMRLIAINVAVFLFVLIFKIGYWATTGNAAAADATIINYLAFPSNPSELLFRFWTPITYMFLHVKFFHFLFNMLILYFVGQLFREFLGARRIVGVYLMGGFVGGMLYFFAYNLLPVFSQTSGYNMGASAGVLAVMVAVTMKVPKFPVNLYFILRVPLWGVTVFILFLDLVNLPVSNPGGHLAHLGGALYGYWFFTRLQQGKDSTIWVNEKLKWLQGFFESKPKLKKVHVSASGKRTDQRDEASDQRKIDVILDKISASGYDSLTKAEKEFLFKYGKK